MAVERYHAERGENETVGGMEYETEKKTLLFVRGKVPFVIFFPLSPQEIHSDGEKTLYLALTLEGLEFGEDETGAELRCLARQYFPNKTIIYESTKTAHLTLLHGEL